MGTARKKQLEVISPSRQLEFLKASALSLAGAIQDYQDMKLKMIDDRHDVVSYIEIDGEAIADAVEVFKQEEFLKGYRVNKVGNDKVTGKVGSK